ncbi:PD40 domain-containing protein [bacterium]|nr:PD40 domain-containing protein [bacterium]
MGHKLKTPKLLFYIILILITSSSLLSASGFGRNKVQRVYRNWYYFSSKHCTIYYTKGMEGLARQAESILETAYDQISSDLGYKVKNKIPVVIYPSQNSFAETNIIMDIIGEEVGGFTESLKNRVVVPFKGSYEEFRHVLEHELTHAVCFDFLYGRGPISLLSPNRLFSMPLWLAEGLAEFESIGWDETSDMYLRDAILNEYIIPLTYLGGFLAYKEGQSVVKFIAEKYGREKLGEIMAKGKIYITINKALKSSIGKDEEELYDEWLAEMRKVYYPQIAEFEAPEELAEPLTDHKETQSFFNIQPSYCPKGDKIAFFSDKSDYTDLYLLYPFENKMEKIAKGERSGDYETFHPFNSAMSWSPDGNILAYVAQRDGRDAIVLYDINKKEQKSILEFKNLHTIASPDWAPHGDYIVFSGLSGEYNDLYLYSLPDNDLTRLTVDKYDDTHPSFSPDGKSLVFSSDRPLEYSEENKFGDYNIFKMDLESKSITPITTDGEHNVFPEWSPTDTNEIAFISSKNGIFNIYKYTFNTGEFAPLTNLLTGCGPFCWNPDGTDLVVSVFYNAGWDLYLVKSPKPADGFPKTAYKSEKDSVEAELEKMTEKADTSKTSQYQKYVFTTVEAEEEDYETAPKRYTPQFTADLVNMSMGYSTFYGFMGQTVLLFSDILGNNQILVMTDLFGNIDESNVYVNYTYLPRRIDYSLIGFHYKDYFSMRIGDTYNYFSDRVYGGGFYAGYPFSKFSRVDFENLFMVVDRKYYEYLFTKDKTTNWQIDLSFVNDYTLWGSTGPINGGRSRLTFEAVPKISENSLSYLAVELDYRKYLKFSRGYSFASRLSCGVADGEKPKHYFLGGMYNWLNYDLANEDIYTFQDMYFSNMVLPLRGYDYFQLEGTKYFLLNLELRYPFVERLSLGLPPLTFYNINGALFFDAAGVTSDEWRKFQWFEDAKLKDVKAGFGLGARINLAYMVLSWDVAWRTDLSNYSIPVHYFSLGAEF